MKREIYKGDIFFADLNGTIGSEQRGIRPVLVVQNNVANKYSPTIIVVPLTKQYMLKLNQPTHYFIRRTDKIKYDSVVLAEQIKAIDIQRIGKKVCHLSDKVMKEIDKKLIVALGINEKNSL